MNIKDFEANKSQGCRLTEMYNRQNELMEKYHDIEKDFRFTTDCPVNLHDKYGQLLLKDFAWRTMEEVAEAIDAISYEGLAPENDLIHAQEEIADALHFLIEMSLLSGIQAKSLSKFVSKPEEGLDLLEEIMYGLHELVSISKAVTQFVTALGMVCHTLKNKPWKQTHMLTDVVLYERRFFNAFRALLQLAVSLDMDAQKVYEMYFRKSEVNKFRQRSNY